MRVEQADRWRHEFFTPVAARKLISVTGEIKAAVLEGTKAPLADHPSTKCRLFGTVKEADAHFRSRREALIEAGYEQVYGTFKNGVMKFSQTGAATVILALDKRRDRH
jgi:hypothetical protein